MAVKLASAWVTLFAGLAAQTSTTHAQDDRRFDKPKPSDSARLVTMATGFCPKGLTPLGDSSLRPRTGPPILLCLESQGWRKGWRERDAFAGEIIFIPAEDCVESRDGQLADGGYLAIERHTLLYSLIGTKFGGDGRVVLAAPDLMTEFAVDSPFAGDAQEGSIAPCLMVNGVYPSRD